MALENIFIGRQPILDTDMNIVAYELLFRTEGAISVQVDDNLYATSRVLINVLNSMGVKRILGEKTGFININEEILKKDILRSIQKDRFVLEILESTKLDSEMIGILTQMKQDGYVFGLDDFEFSDEMIAYFDPIYDLISIIKVDLKLNDRAKVASRMSKFTGKNIKLLAEKVENMEEYQAYKKMGFQLFQGYFFEKPTIIKGRSIDPSKMAVMELINMVYKDADVDKLENSFKRYPELTINLLQFINSAAISSRSRIESVKQALALLGQKQILSWLVLMAYAQHGEVNAGNPLLTSAMERAKTMELLARKIDISKHGFTPDEAFLTGLLSLLDALFQSPMEEVLNGLNISPDIKKAILNHENKLGKILLLALKVEGNVIEDIKKLIFELNVTIADLNSFVSEGFCWAQANGINPSKSC